MRGQTGSRCAVQSLVSWKSRREMHAAQVLQLCHRFTRQRCWVILTGQARSSPRQDVFRTSRPIYTATHRYQAPQATTTVPTARTHYRLCLQHVALAAVQICKSRSRPSFRRTCHKRSKSTPPRPSAASENDLLSSCRTRALASFSLLG